MEALGSPSSFNIVFAGTSPFAVPALESLCEAGYRVSAVITQPDRPKGRGHAMQPPPIKIKASELHLPVHQPQSVKNDEARRLFEELAPDLLVVVAYGKILPPWLLALPRFGALNLHGSLLPRYRGAAPMQWAMANGDPETGVCLMQIDEGLDTGPVYGCEATPIDPEESLEVMADRLARLGSALLVRQIPAIVAGTLRPVAQDNSRASVARMLTKQDGLVDWSLPARSIHDRIRAFHPWPGARTGFRGAPLRILASRVGGPAPEGALPGDVLAVAAPRRVVAVVCGDGLLLELDEVQLPNKKPQSGFDFVNGLRVTNGEKLHRLEEGVADNVARG